MKYLAYLLIIKHAILTIILLGQFWKQFIPEVVLWLSISEAQSRVQPNFQVRAIILVERLPNQIPSHVWGWITVTNISKQIVYYVPIGIYLTVVDVIYKQMKSVV